MWVGLSLLEEEQVVLTVADLEVVAIWLAVCDVVGETVREEDCEAVRQDVPLRVRLSEQEGVVLGDCEADSV